MLVQRVFTLYINEEERAKRHVPNVLGRRASHVPFELSRHEKLQGDLQVEID